MKKNHLAIVGIGIILVVGVGLGYPNLTSPSGWYEVEIHEQSTDRLSENATITPYEELSPEEKQLFDRALNANDRYKITNYTSSPPRYVSDDDSIYEVTIYAYDDGGNLIVSFFLYYGLILLGVLLVVIGVAGLGRQFLHK